MDNTLSNFIPQCYTVLWPPDPKKRLSVFPEHADNYAKDQIWKAFYMTFALYNRIKHKLDDNSV